MSAIDDTIILVSDEEGDSVETSQNFDLYSDDEDVVAPRRRPIAKPRTTHDEFFSDIESDDEPIHIASTRSQTRPQQNGRARVTSNEEVSFLEEHFDHLEDKDEHTTEGVHFHLEDFKIQKKATGQLESLHRVAVHDNKSKPQYCFSGTLTHEDGSRQRVSEVDIWHVSIDNLAGIEDNLEPSTATAAQSIFLETVNSSRFNCFYLLTIPTVEYKEIYQNFQWLADFLKHITDYLTWSSMQKISVKLQNFKIDFIEKVRSWHSDNEDFGSWHNRCGGQIDFRHHLCCPTNLKFIFYTIESIVDDKDDLLQHTVWEDLGLPKQIGEPRVAPQTLVTTRVANAFLESFSHWGKDRMDLLEVVDLESTVSEQSTSVSHRVKLGAKSSYDQTSNFEVHDGKRVSKAALFLERASTSMTVNIPARALVGHAIVARRHSYRCSRPCTCDTYKLALVVSASDHEVGVRWLDLPLATTCAGRLPEKRKHENQHPFYPIGNEVFLSDECCCSKVLKSDVFAMTSITINEDHAEEYHELFVHRKWIRSESKICTFENDEIRLCPEHEDYTLPLPRRRSVGQEVAKIVSLFSGLGLLDHGLFEGSNGAVASSLVVELDRDAILSYKANHKGDQPCEFLNVDVNEPFRAFCLGQKDFRTFNLLAAGNPCPGFSRRNANKASVRSQKDCTLLAHTLSWIDVFRPEMVLIENVPGMDETKPSALGQAVCCLVSMGYQIKVMTIKASTYGAATDRTRLIVMATAPGISLPSLPSATHGPSREQQCLVTASAVTSDLDAITNDTLINPEMPYHIPVLHMAPLVHGIVTKIPRTPKLNNRMPNISDARLEGPGELAFLRKLTNEQRKKSAGTLRRVHPNQPFRTLTTHFSVTDARGPAILHWLQDRLISLQETRRFQGVPDEFIQIGSTDKQLRQIGNSVEYNLARLLGRCFAAVWKGISMDGGRVHAQVTAIDDIVVHALSDDDDDDDDDDENFQNILKLRSPSSSKQKAVLVSVDIPSVEKVRRQLRDSLSLEPSVEITDEDCDLSAPETSYSRRTRDVVPYNDDDDDDQDQNTNTSEPESSSSWESLSAPPQSLSSDDDDLLNIQTLLTPSRLRSKDLSAEPRRRKVQPSTPISSRQPARFTVRRRRRSSSAEGSDEDESPTKKLKLKGFPWSSSKSRSSTSRYVFGTPGSYSPSTSTSEGESVESPIVID